MDAFLQAMSSLADPKYWIALAAAIGIGTVVGFIPGVGATLVTAIMLPSVLFLIEDPAIGIVMLAMVGALNNTLDAIPAVLVGLPSSETQVTYFEGHQLARQGKAAHTLGAVYAVSAMGGVIGAIALAIMIPIVRPFILQFSYAEVAVLALFGVAMIALLARGSMAKGVAAGLFGLLLGTVGVDPVNGVERFTLGELQLWAGLPIITTILGFFALPELIDLTMTRSSVASKDAVVSNREVFRGALYGLRRWPMVIRQSLFGTFMGAVPGIGGSVIDWLSYAFGVSLAKDRKKQNFGKGSLEGVLFAESANNSKAGGQALPTLTLGIPGSTSWAIIVVAILAYGLSPGPRMVEQYADVTMLMVITLALGNLIVAGIGLVATNYLARVTRIPYPVVGFMIMALVFLAAWMDIGAWLIFPILLTFTVAGLLMKRYGWPRPPLILGFILGPIIEQNIQSAISIYGGIGPVFTRPIALVLLGLLVITVFILMRLSSRQPDIDDAEELMSAGDESEHSDRMPAGPVGAATPAGDHQPSGGAAAQGGHTATTSAAPQSSGTAAGISLKARVLQEDNIAPVLFAAAALAFFFPALKFPADARMLPLATATGVIVLCLVQLVIQVVRPGKSNGQVMDLGMRSSEYSGSLRAGFVLLGLIVLCFLAAGVIGLQYAAVGLAAIGPALLLTGRMRWVSAALSGGLVWLFSEVLMNEIIGVIWPNPFILEWFQGLF